MAQLRGATITQGSLLESSSPAFRSFPPLHSGASGWHLDTDHDAKFITQEIQTSQAKASTPDCLLTCGREGQGSSFCHEATVKLNLAL